MKNQYLIYSRYYTYIKPITRLPIVKNYGATIFTLAVMTIFILFAIKPTVETILILQKKLADSEQILEKINQKSNNLSLGKKNYDALDENIKDRLSEAIPDTANFRSIIQTLEQTAKIHEASVSALQIQPLILEAKNDDHLGILSEINFTFNIEGDYKNLTFLLQDFKSSARLVSIDSISISKLSEGSGLIMSISGKAYYIK